MRNDVKLFAVDLMLFDGEGGDGAGNATAQGDTSGAVPDSTHRGKKSGEYANIVFGKQNSDAGNADPEPQGGSNSTKATKESRKAAFRDLVNGEYKDIYTEDTQRMIDRRFKETRGLEAKVSAQQPIIDTLMRRYGISDGNIEALAKAVNDDTAYWERVSEQTGLPPEQCKRLERLEQLEMQNAELLRERSVKKQVSAWYAEADALKARFPNFDFEYELENPQFVSMLKSGVPVEHAFKVLHMDELMQSVMQTTAATTEKRVVDNVRSRGARPQENGTASRSAVTVKDDVTRLTKKDRAEIAARAARGEIIKF